MVVAVPSILQQARDCILFPDGPPQQQQQQQYPQPILAIFAAPAANTDLDIDDNQDQEFNGVFGVGKVQGETEVEMSFESPRPTTNINNNITAPSSGIFDRFGLALSDLASKVFCFGPGIGEEAMSSAPPSLSSGNINKPVRGVVVVQPAIDLYQVSNVSQQQPVVPSIERQATVESMMQPPVQQRSPGVFKRMFSAVKSIFGKSTKNDEEMEVHPLPATTVAPSSPANDNSNKRKSNVNAQDNNSTSTSVTTLWSLPSLQPTLASDNGFFMFSSLLFGKDETQQQQPVQPKKVQFELPQKRNLNAGMDEEPPPNVDYLDAMALDGVKRMSEHRELQDGRLRSATRNLTEFTPVELDILANANMLSVSAQQCVAEEKLEEATALWERAILAFKQVPLTVDTAYCCLHYSIHLQNIDNYETAADILFYALQGENMLDLRKPGLLKQINKEMQKIVTELQRKSDAISTSGGQNQNLSLFQILKQKVKSKITIKRKKKNNNPFNNMQQQQYGGYR